MATVATPSAFSQAALTAELQTDPNGLGYAPLIAAGQDAQLATLMNDQTKNPTQVVWNNAVSVNSINSAFNPTEYDSLSTNKLLQLLVMLTGSGPLDATNANVRAIFNDIFSGKTNTLANFVAVAQRAGSRAEALWGTGFQVTSQEISQAR